MMSAADIARVLGGARREGQEWRWAGCDQRDLRAELRTRRLLEAAFRPHNHISSPRQLRPRNRRRRELRSTLLVIKQMGRTRLYCSARCRAAVTAIADMMWWRAS
jgi:hypothetical protein